MKGILIKNHVNHAHIETFRLKSCQTHLNYCLEKTQLDRLSQVQIEKHHQLPISDVIQSISQRLSTFSSQFSAKWKQILRIWLASNLIMNIKNEGVVNLKKANISETKGMARIKLYKMDWPNFLLWLSQYKFDWLPWTFDYCAAVLGRWGFSLQDIGKLHHSTSLFSSKISFLFTSKLLTKTVDVI